MSAAEYLERISTKEAYSFSDNYKVSKFLGVLENGVIKDFIPRNIEVTFRPLLTSRSTGERRPKAVLFASTLK